MTISYSFTSYEPKKHCTVNKVFCQVIFLTQHIINSPASVTIIMHRKGVSSMIITSLLTEYNPFHNALIHRIEAARRLTRADVVIAIVSGNFTQRGEIAIADKFTRAEAAVRHVDLVVELPLYNAVSYADD